MLTSKLSAVLVLVTAFAPLARPVAATAQVPPTRLPAKPQSPLDRQRDLAIPTRLPGIRQSAAAPTRAKPKINPGRRSNPRPAPPPRPRSTGSSGGSYGALKAESGKNCRVPPPNQMVSFDFEGEVEKLVKWISEITCRNFILTNKVRSQKIQILSPSRVLAKNAWRVFLAVLESNDFTVEPAGSFWKVIQANDGTRSTIPFYDEGRSLRGPGKTFASTNQMVTKLYRVRHGGNTNNIVNYLNIFKSNRGQLHPFQGSNLIVMTDFAASLERIESILAELDQPEALERIHVVPVQFASASEIAEKLTQIFEPKNAQARKAGGATATPQLANQRKAGEKKPAAPKGRTQVDPSSGGGSGGGSVSKILADDRTNSLIIIASESAFGQIVALLRRLDIPGDQADGQIHVLRLKHADAEELASTLSSLAQGRPTSGNPRPAANNRRVAPATPPRAGSTSAALFQGEVKVTADKATNSLVVTASKSDLASMRRVIDQLDVPRYQVFVEAAILEVSTSNTRDLGVGWHGGVPVEVDGETSPLIFANTPTNELSSLVNTINPLGLASLLGLATAFRGPTLDGTEGLPGVPQGGIPAIGVVLQALQTSNDVNVVSTPHLLTMDNEEAEIQVSQKIPFPSGLNLGGLGGLAGLAGAQGANGATQGLGNLGGLGLNSVSFNREDVGLTLKIKPQINDEDYVRLEVDQELSDIAGTEPVTGQLITSERSAKTTVVVRSQDSVVIGGLMRDRETRGESKFPILGDIPVLGWLFKQQNTQIEKVNLVLIITPYIIRGPKDFRKIFERKMEERREFVDRFYGQTKEYRAEIDWSRKMGPVAAYQQAMKRELMRAENDGPGLPGQVIIRAEEGDDLGEAPRSSSGGGITPVTPALPPPEVLRGGEEP
ncbi:MAG: type II secretion system secretin GspD, partial [Myxococcota bacterium]